MVLSRTSIVLSLIFIGSLVNTSCTKKIPAYQKNIEEKKVEQLTQAEMDIEQARDLEKKEKELRNLEKGITHGTDENIEHLKELEEKQKK